MTFTHDSHGVAPMMMANDLWVPLVLLSLIIAAAIAFSRAK
ncbi:hypothetical protein [Leptolyngbya sp. KIOST-1]|nr:hypothetical protein [Leptolyngbya sp. KIOST-1]